MRGKGLDLYWGWEHLTKAGTTTMDGVHADFGNTIGLWFVFRPAGVVRDNRWRASGDLNDGIAQRVASGQTSADVAARMGCHTSIAPTTCSTAGFAIATPGYWWRSA
jgi:hypothetical protein